MSFPEGQINDPLIKRCPHCGNTLPYKAKRCVFCGKLFSVPGWAIVLFVLFGLGAAFNFLNPGSASGSTTAVASVPAEPKPINSRPILVATLSAEYDRNEVAADLKYKDKLILISGKIDDIGKDSFDEEIYITLDIGKYFSTVHCYFPDINAQSVAKLLKGQYVLVEGYCNGEMVLGDIKLENCAVKSIDSYGYYGTARIPTIEGTLNRAISFTVGSELESKTSYYYYEPKDISNDEIQYYCDYLEYCGLKFRSDVVTKVLGKPVNSPVITDDLVVIAYKTFDAENADNSVEVVIVKGTKAVNGKVAIGLAPTK